METTNQPALWPALGLALGALGGVRLEVMPWGGLGVWGVLLLVVGGAAVWRRLRVGWFCCGLALGVLVAQAGPGEGTLEQAVEEERPVRLVGVVAQHALVDGEEARVRLRVERVEALRGGGREAAADVWVALPEGVEPPIFGSRIAVKGYVGQRRPDGNLPIASPGAFRLRLVSGRFLEVIEPAALLWLRVTAVRQRLRHALESEGMTPARGLLLALVLGDRSALPESWEQGLRRCGLAHLLAVSGLHLGLVAALAFVPGLPMRLRSRCALAAFLVMSYLLILGPRPSVLRAAAMALLALAALALERPPQALNALACGVAVLLLSEPTLVEDLGLQLSAAATLGILLLAPGIERCFHRLPRGLGRPLAASVAAQGATLPLVWPLVGGLHPLAPLLGLLAVPWLALFLGVSLVASTLALFWPAAASTVFVLLEPLAAPLDAFAHLPASGMWLLPWSPSPGAPWAVLGCLGLWAWSAEAQPPLACWLRRACAALILTALVSWVGFAEAPPSLPELVMLDVGQGDGFLLRDGEHTLLVDGGGWPQGDFGGRRLVPVLAHLGVARLDAVALTHPDRDHCSGLLGVTRHLVVETLWTAPGAGAEPCGGELLSVAGPRLISLWRGEERRLGRWRMRVLHPGPGDAGAGNDQSLVLAAEVFGRRFLLTGDIEARAELALRRREGAEGLGAEVLKVAHHGSRSSTTGPFLRAVAPRLALISAGAGNPYGHPTADVVKRLETFGARVLRTDQHGQVGIRITPGGTFLVRTTRAPVGQPESR